MWHCTPTSKQGERVGRCIGIPVVGPSILDGKCEVSFEDSSVQYSMFEIDPGHGSNLSLSPRGREGIHGNSGYAESDKMQISRFNASLSRALREWIGPGAGVARSWKVFLGSACTTTTSFPATPLPTPNHGFSVPISTSWGPSVKVRFPSRSLEAARPSDCSTPSTPS